MIGLDTVVGINIALFNLGVGVESQSVSGGFGPGFPGFEVHGGVSYSGVINLTKVLEDSGIYDLVMKQIGNYLSTLSCEVVNQIEEVIGKGAIDKIINYKDGTRKSTHKNVITK